MATKGSLRGRLPFEYDPHVCLTASKTPLNLPMRNGPWAAISYSGACRSRAAAPSSSFSIELT
jgi:hypothetical protein